jgi:hypothetical protein
LQLVDQVFLPDGNSPAGDLGPWIAVAGGRIACGGGSAPARSTLQRSRGLTTPATWEQAQKYSATA